MNNSKADNGCIQPLEPWIEVGYSPIPLQHIKTGRLYIYILPTLH